jgi:hypothetical protein
MQLPCFQRLATNAIIIIAKENKKAKPNNKKNDQFLFLHIL